jgi:hypothetical protein
MPESIGGDGSGEAPFFNVVQTYRQGYQYGGKLLREKVLRWDEEHSKDQDGNPYLWAETPDKLDHKLKEAEKSCWKCGEQLDGFFKGNKEGGYEPDEHNDHDEGPEPPDDLIDEPEPRAQPSSLRDVRREGNTQSGCDWAGNPVSWKPSGTKSNQIVRLSQVEDAPVEWLWHAWLALQAVGLLQGEPGQGKTQLLLLITACITRGLPMPDGSRGATFGKPANVLIFTNEDTKGLIKSRLRVLGADLDRVVVLTPADVDLSLPSGRFELEAFIAAISPALVVIDPIHAFVDEGINLESAKMALVINALSRLAVKWNLSVVLVQHKTKTYTKKLLTQGIGSVTIGGGARFALNIAPFNGVKVIKSAKISWATPPEDLYYKIESATDEWIKPDGEFVKTEVSKVVMIDKPGKDVVPAAKGEPAAQDQAKVIETLREADQWMSRKALAKVTGMKKAGGEPTQALIDAVTALTEGGYIVERKGKRDLREYHLPLDD